MDKMAYFTEISSGLIASFVPRCDFNELEKEMNIPGMYMMVGKQGRTFRPVYIGVSEGSVAHRAQAHGSDYWDYVILIGIKNYEENNIDVTSLEHIFISIASIGDQFFCMNKRFSSSYINEETKIAAREIYEFFCTIGHGFQVKNHFFGGVDYTLRELCKMASSSVYQETVTYGSSSANVGFLEDGGVILKAGSRCSSAYIDNEGNFLSEDQLLRKEYYLRENMVGFKSKSCYVQKDMMFESLSNAMKIITLDVFEREFDWRFFIFGPFKNGRLPYEISDADEDQFVYQLEPLLFKKIQSFTRYNYAGYGFLQNLEQIVIKERQLKKFKELGG